MVLTDVFANGLYLSILKAPDRQYVNDIKNLIFTTRGLALIDIAISWTDASTVCENAVDSSCYVGQKGGKRLFFALSERLFLPLSPRG